MNKKKIIIVTIVIIVLGIALWLIFKKPTEKTPETKVTSDGDSVIIDTTFPLKNGSKGSAVSSLQKYLNTKYNAGLKVDGVWGILTNNAVTTYLKRDNISSAIYKDWNIANA